MRFLTLKEIQIWCKNYGFTLSEEGRLSLPSTEKHSIHLNIPQPFTSLTWFCEHLEFSLRPRETCLLWVTGWGIFHENLHLYYKMRQSYGDHQLLHEAPGHLFLNYESADLVSFIQTAIICGWDAHLIPTIGYSRAFISHDEFVEFASDDNNPSLVDDFAKKLIKNNK
jgi:hypothetical protein